MTDPRIEEVLDFWREAGPTKWFSADQAFDAEIRRRFIALHEAAAAGELASWRDTPEGALALVLLTDQFPRNMFRGRARAYATDGVARTFAADAIARGFDEEVGGLERQFFYLPFMHSEDLRDQERCVALYRACPELADSLRWAEHHREIIARFGRFPHRNAILGRPTSEDEQRFLEEGGFSG